MAKAEVKQYLFVSNRNITITSTLGYSIAFERGIPIHVPKRMHSEVMEKGCLPCDASGKILDAPEVEVTPVAKVLIAPEDADERNAAINTVMETIVKRNNPLDFSAGGVPSAQAVTLALGWKVDAREIRPLWNKMKQDMVARA